MFRLGRLSVFVACGVSCGGVLSTEVPDAGLVGLEASSPPLDASTGDDAATSDGSTPSLVPDAPYDAPSCFAIAVELDKCFPAPGSPPCDGGWQFTRMSDFEAFFEQLAKLNGLVVAAHGVDCSAAGLDAGRCNYDPTTPRLDPSDVHYSDVDQRLIGPDGKSYVWMYDADRNTWLLAETNDSPGTYALILSYEQCIQRDQ